MTLKEFFANPDFVSIGNKLLREIITENPEFVYNNVVIGMSNGCHYWRGVGSHTEPSPNPCNGCLFGQMFQKAGVSKEHLKQKNYGNLRGFDITLSVEVPEYWIKMQDKQDQGAKWGDLLQHLPES